MKQVKYPLPLLLLLISLLLFSGCVATGSTSTGSEAATRTTATETSTVDNALFPLTITDAAGQEFTFERPVKIGCIWAGCQEILADLGVAPYATGYADEQADSVFFYPVGLPDYRIEDTSNPEHWAASEADIVISRVPADPSNDAINEAVPVFYLHHPSYGESSEQGYQAFIKNLEIVSQLIGQPEAAEAAVTRFRNTIANLQRFSTPDLTAQQVAILFSGDGYGGLTPTNPFCVALAETGLGECVDAAAEGEAWLDLNAEQFLSLDPDWIVYMGVTVSHTERTDPVWKELTAIKEGRVYDAQGHRYYCCSLRGIIHGLQEYAHYVVPEANIPAPGFWLDFDPLQSPLIVDDPIADDASFPLTITDALGQVFTFDTPPKLACDWHGCYETMADLGVVLHAAAMRPEMLDSIFYAPVGLPEHIIEDLSNPELWAATEMDVFLSRVPDDPYYDVLREMVPVFFLHHPSYGVSSETGYQAYIANTRLLGQLSGQPEAAEATIAQFETVLANLQTLSTPELAEQSVGLIWSGEGYFGLATDNPFCVLLADVGLGRCMGESTGRFIEYNAEEILALNPDLIIYMLEGGESHTERTDPIWPELTAVKEGRIYDVIGHRYTCCSLRGLIHSFQEYVSYVLPEAGIPAPGPVETFDPAQSPLVQADFVPGQAQE